MFKEVFKKVRESSPLVHNITNYVTVNDCANILLACGASPIMADDTEDATEITQICGGLNINIGTLNKNTIPAMFSAGKKSNELSHPVLLDPVGVGASSLRTNTANQLLEEVKFNVIRGNISEIKTLALGSGTTKGVDADMDDVATKENLPKVVAFGKKLAEATGAVIVITGAIDIIADKNRAMAIYNGNPMMSRITGAGCMLSALTTAFITANPGNIFEASATAVICMGIAGEKAFKRMTELDGNSTYRNYLIDAIYNLKAEDIEKEGKYENY